MPDEEVALLMYWGNGGWGGGEWLAMSAVMLVFWGAFAALTVWAVRSSSGGGRPDHDPVGGADTLLAERFARGEIDSEEFTRHRALLHSSAAGPGSRR